MNCRFMCSAPLVLVLAAAGVVMFGQRASAAGEGKITGTIKFAGTPPRAHAIDLSGEPTCEQQHAGHPLLSEKVVVGPDGGLANAVVYLSEGLSVNAAEAVPSQPREIDQKGCQYVPHVLAVDVNQSVRVVNSDHTSHNVHVVSDKNPEWDKTQASGAPPVETKFSQPEVITVRCNAHPWMKGYIVVVKGPYAVTDDHGAFTISNVPPGSYTLTAWQETYGTQTMKVTVAPGKTANAEFTFKPE